MREEFDSLILTCTHIMTAESDYKKAIEEFLRYLTIYYDAGRVYLCDAGSSEKAYLEHESISVPLGKRIAHETFLCMDNPKKHEEDLTFLYIGASYITEEIEKQLLKDQISELKEAVQKRGDREIG